MTDMRATERLLEVIVEQTSKIEAIHADGSMDDFDIYGLRDALDPLREAITELRRRGDTLVRRDDLRTVIERDWADLYTETLAESEGFRSAWNRLEIALGGKLR